MVYQDDLIASNNRLHRLNNDQPIKPSLFHLLEHNLNTLYYFCKYSIQLLSIGTYTQRFDLTKP